MSHPQSPDLPTGRSEQGAGEVSLAEPDSPGQSPAPQDQPSRPGGQDQADLPYERLHDGRPPPGAGGNRQGMILTLVVAVAALGLGGYFLVSSAGNTVLAASSSSTASRQSDQVTGGASPTPQAAQAPFAAQAPGSAPTVAFSPPTDYNTGSLITDPGCVDYDNATTASSAAIGDQPTQSQAVAALTVLGGSLHTAARQAQDPTLAAALAAEATFVQQNQSTLVTALVSGNSDSQVTAYQPIENTDDYVSAVCGSDQSTDTSSD